MGVLDSNTLRVQSFVDEECVYEAIYVLQVFLKTDLHFNAINERLHMAFPNPIIMLDHLFGTQTGPFASGVSVADYGDIKIFG